MTPGLTDVIVGVDGSTESLHAVDWAAVYAVRRHRPLRIVHAFIWPLLHVPLDAAPSAPPESGLHHAAQQILADATVRAQTAAPKLTITTAMPIGQAAAALVEASRHGSLVVVGSRGLGGFTGLVVGSVGVQLAAHARTPVVVVRTSTVAAGPSAGQVVVGVDGSPHSAQAIEFAFDQAAFLGTGVVAVHAYRWPEHDARGEMLPLVYDTNGLASEENRMLAESLAGWREKYPDVPVTRKLVRGRPGAALVAESAGAALVAVGSRGRGGFAGLLLGSVSQAVLHHAASPVAVVRD
jgi:nucleotide-binding universal stress UspA family protein